jgi:excisionase family DNA binding protein
VPSHDSHRRPTLKSAAENLARLTVEGANAQAARAVEAVQILQSVIESGADAAVPVGLLLPRPWESPCFMSVVEAAEYLSVPPQIVRRLLRGRVIWGYNFGGSIGWRVDRDHLREFVRQQVLAALRGAVTRGAAP